MKNLPADRYIFDRQQLESLMTQSQTQGFLSATTYQGKTEEGRSGRGHAKASGHPQHNDQKQTIMGNDPRDYSR